MSKDTCPKCGSDRIYQGLAALECPTRECPNFSQKQLNEVFDAAADALFKYEDGTFKRSTETLDEQMFSGSFTRFVSRVIPTPPLLERTKTNAKCVPEIPEVDIKIVPQKNNFGRTRRLKANWGGKKF